MSSDFGFKVHEVGAIPPHDTFDTRVNWKERLNATGKKGTTYILISMYLRMRDGGTGQVDAHSIPP